MAQNSTQGYQYKRNDNTKLPKISSTIKKEQTTLLSQTSLKNQYNNNKELPPIYIIDALPGVGKTSAMITYINEHCINNINGNNTEGNNIDNNKSNINSSDITDSNNDINTDERFMYVTPFLSEVKRIQEACPQAHFSDPMPTNKFGSKYISVLRSIQQRKNIITTHSLFQAFSRDTMAICEDNDYVLIMDEAFDVIKPCKIGPKDWHTIITNYAHIEENGMVIWDDEDYQDTDERLLDIKYLCDTHSLFAYGTEDKQVVFVWTFPIEVFKSFKKIYILTYMFEGQIQAYYYEYFNVPFQKLYVKSTKPAITSEKFNTSWYHLTEEPQIYKSKIKDLIQIYEGNLNNIGSVASLSNTWYMLSDKQEEFKILRDQLRNNLYNFFFHKVPIRDKNLVMWTTFKSHYPVLKQKGYSSPGQFVPCNARATNDYCDRANLAYTINVFVNPLIKNFFMQRNIVINENLYALSELVQWIYRSRIRQEQSIYIYLPSARMRNLLQEYINHDTDYSFLLAENSIISDDDINDYNFSNDMIDF